MIDFKRLTPEEPKICVKQKGREQIIKGQTETKKVTDLTNVLNVVMHSCFVV